MKEVKDLLTRIAVAVERIAEAILVERQADPMAEYRRRQQDQASGVTGR